MKTEICKNTNDLVEIAVKAIQNQLNTKPDSVLALACGETMKPLWAALSGLSMKKARVLCVTELIGVEESRTCRHALTEGLIERTDLRPENCFFPDADAPEAYDRLIDALGGIDLAVLGIGEDCHIGYNEPGTLFDTLTHVQKLTDRTRLQLKRRGFSEEELPGYAVTLGIRDLTRAKKILLLAFGEEKAAAVFQMLYAKTTSYVPAAYLQIPLEVTVLLDGAAAAKL
jgi:glucosamine-6-phosphate deaminase